MKNETDELILKINSYYQKKIELIDRHNKGEISNSDYHNQITDLENGTSFMIFREEGDLHINQQNYHGRIENS